MLNETISLLDNDELESSSISPSSSISISSDSQSQSQLQIWSQSSSQPDSHSEYHPVVRSAYSLAYSTHNQRAFDILIAGFSLLILSVWTFRALLATPEISASTKLETFKWQAALISAISIKGDFNVRVMQSSSSNTKIISFSTALPRTERKNNLFSFLPLLSFSQTAIAAKISLDTSSNSGDTMATTYVISPVYKSAWLPVSANVRPELFITVPCELSSFSMTAKNANLMYSGPNINTSVSVVFTNSGVIQFATPINAAQVVTLSTGGSKGSIYASDISATKIELKALKYGGGSGGTVEGIFSKYFQFSALNEIGPLRFALYPSVSRNLQPVRHDIESRNGQIDIICSKYKGHFTVSGTSDVFLSGVDWPIEKFEPTVGTVGGREAGDGVFDVVGSKGRKVVLDFR